MCLVLGKDQEVCNEASWLNEVLIVSWTVKEIFKLINLSSSKTFSIQSVDAKHSIERKFLWKILSTNSKNFVQPLNKTRQSQRPIAKVNWRAIKFHYEGKWMRHYILLADYHFIRTIMLVFRLNLSIVIFHTTQ